MENIITVPTDISMIENILNTLPSSEVFVLLLMSIVLYFLFRVNKSNLIKEEHRAREIEVLESSRKEQNDLFMQKINSIEESINTSQFMNSKSQSTKKELIDKIDSISSALKQDHQIQSGLIQDIRDILIELKGGLKK